MTVVNVRSFDGSDDVIRVTAPPYTGMGTAYTWAAVLKRSSTGSFHSPLSIGGAGTASPNVVFTYTNGGDFEARHGGGTATQSSYDWATADLLLVVVTGDGSFDHPDFHIYEDGVGWTHLTDDGSGSGIPADWTALSDEELRFGNWNSSFNYFHGLMVVQALWRGTKLNQSQVEALAGGDRDDWVTAGADHLWEFQQASTATGVTDYVGSCNQIGITGTTVTTLDVPATVYQIASSGSDATVTAVPADGTGDIANPALAAGSVVTSPVLDGTGDIAVPVVSGSASATVVAVPLDATGDVANPVVGTGATVVAPVLDATGDVVTAGMPMSAALDAPTLDATGDMGTPVVTSSAASVVSAVPVDATGDVANPALVAGAVVAAVPADATGDVANPAVEGGAPPAGGGGSRLLMGVGA
jgi:hypothetical protein